MRFLRLVFILDLGFSHNHAKANRVRDTFLFTEIYERVPILN